MNSQLLHRLSAFERIGAHTLRVQFTDGSRQAIEFALVLVGELYGPLQDADASEQVRLDAEVHTGV